MKKLQIKKVKRITCPQCGELQVKIFPNSSYGLTVPGKVNDCIKCINKKLKKKKHLNK